MNKQDVQQAVVGVSVARPLFAEATVTWNKVDGATAYNVYYKEHDSAEYSSDLTYYTISYLNRGSAYQFKVAAVDGSGREYAWTEEKKIENIHPM